MGEGGAAESDRKTAGCKLGLTPVSLIPTVCQVYIHTGVGI